jgi:PadR family transcriptional regulator, regulatory protein AphA
VSLTTTEAAILGLLRKGPMSGYDLRKDAERSVGYFWAPAKTQIYATLPKLVDAGYARSRKVAQSARPDKVVYQITERGVEALRQWIAEAPLEAGHGRNLILLKLFVSDPGDVPALLPQIAERRADAQRLRDELVELDAAGIGDATPFERLTRRYGFLHADAVLRWAEETEQALEATFVQRGDRAGPVPDNAEPAARARNDVGS